MSGDRDDILMMNGIKEFITSKWHRNRDGFPIHGECIVCGWDDHVRKDCPERDTRPRANYAFPRGGKVPKKPRCEELCGKGYIQQFWNHYDERKKYNAKKTLDLTAKTSTMFLQRMAKTLRDFSEENPYDHPPVIKGHALMLYNQLRGLSMMCYSNTQFLKNGRASGTQ